MVNTMTDPLQHRDFLREFYLAGGEAFLGEIDPEHVDQVIEDLIHLKRTADAITLVIQSPGGDTAAGFGLAQFIEQELRTNITARVWGQCSSAATYPLLCCKKRIAHPEAIFVLHRQTAGIEFRYDLNFKKRLKEWDRDNQQIHRRQVDFYHRKLDLTRKEVEEILLQGMGVDDALSVKQARKIGLITDVSKL